MRPQPATRHTPGAATRRGGALALHEALSQTLFAARLLAGNLVRQAERGGGTGSAWLESARTLERLNRGALAELQALQAELQPTTALAGVSVAGRLQPLLQALQCRGDIRVQARLSPTDTLAPAQRQHVYRIAQEALANACRHSGCQQLQLHWAPDAPEGPQLRIADDGCGFDPAHTPGCGAGLHALAVHAKALGAELTLDTRPGGGTRLTLQLPPGPAPLNRCDNGRDNGDDSTPRAGRPPPHDTPSHPASPAGKAPPA